MDLWFSILPTLLIGALILATGFLFVRESGQDFRIAAVEGAVWASAFFISFSVETLLIANN